jgi:hypothetical protein
VTRRVSPLDEGARNFHIPLRFDAAAGAEVMARSNYAKVEGSKKGNGSSPKN